MIGSSASSCTTVLRKDLVWLVRAAHHFPTSELNGRERLPRDDGVLQRLVSHLDSLRKEHFHDFRPRPWSNPKVFPVVCFGSSVEACFPVVVWHGLAKRTLGTSIDGPASPGLSSFSSLEKLAMSRGQSHLVLVPPRCSTQIHHGVCTPQLDFGSGFAWKWVPPKSLEKICYHVYTVSDYNHMYIYIYIEVKHDHNFRLLSILEQTTTKLS